MPYSRAQQPTAEVKETARGGPSNSTRRLKQLHAEASGTAHGSQSNQSWRPKQPHAEAEATTCRGTVHILRNHQLSVSRPTHPSVIKSDKSPIQSDSLHYL